MKKGLKILLDEQQEAVKKASDATRAIEMYKKQQMHLRMYDKKIYSDSHINCGGKNYFFGGLFISKKTCTTYAGNICAKIYPIKKDGSRSKIAQTCYNPKEIEKGWL